MKRALALPGLGLLSACEPQMIYVHDTMYVISWYVMAGLLAVGVAALAFVVAFVYMVCSVVRDRMRGKTGDP